MHSQTRQGARSVGGSTRLLPTIDGWVALSLARDDDVALLAAALEVERSADTGGALWARVADVLAGWCSRDVVERTSLVGLACSAVGEVAAHGLARAAPLGSGRLRSQPSATRTLRDGLVVDLSSLWAGPLCGELLARAGATVVKVESVGRPDGARHGPPAFFDLLNGAKPSVALDLTASEGRRRLRALLACADVVIEASRPRALMQLGIDVAEIAAEGRLRVWVSLTGHGRDDVSAMRVAFGDDAAAAGGLVAWEHGEPRFVGDAIADPASGLVAAVAVLDRLRAGGAWLLDVALARTAAHLARGPVTDACWRGAIAAPVARAAVRRAAACGADTATVLARLGIT